ncbi:hypothetical protein GDO86_019896, partial [Hymenochirus boettgeri]
ARTKKEDNEFHSHPMGLMVPDYGDAHLTLKPFYSRSKSFLKLRSLLGELSCDRQQEIQAEYLIKRNELGAEQNHTELYYLVTSRRAIRDSGTLDVPIGSMNEVLRGEVSINLVLSADVSPEIRVLVYVLLSNGDIVADSAKFTVQRCFKNKVSVKFSPKEVLPGEDVSLLIQASAGSLCALRVVDKSVVLMRPERELTSDKEIHLKIITSADIKNCPDTRVKWNAGVFCVGPSGFGLSSPDSVLAFQPFFVDLILPYFVNTAEPCPGCRYTSCLVADENKLFYWNLKASKHGKLNITVKTEALNTQDLCHNDVPIVPAHGSTDTVMKPLIVNPGGVLEEKTHSSLICSQEGERLSETEEIFLNVPNNTVKDSERAQITALGDLMGTAMQNLDRLLAMPYGCGEQNMVLFAPNIFILQYLEKTHQLNQEIQSKAKTFLESGYQRQLTYKHDDGSYSAFGTRDPAGNTWLTAFVMKSFSKAHPYIFIDENHINHSFNWLKNDRHDNGCFRNVGKLFNNAMKGGVDDEVTLTAYVTIALLEVGFPSREPVVAEALVCLKKHVTSLNNVYTQALLAYTFTLSGNTQLAEHLMDLLDEEAIELSGQLYWGRGPATEVSDFPPWHRAPSAEVEITSYVLLAMLSGRNKDLDKASEIVNWLSKQQNPYGGFSSTQDTVVALQALAKYAEATFNNKGEVTVTVTSKSGFREQFHLDKTNRLLLQKASLPHIPGDYTVSASGNGCVFVQTILRYNILPYKNDATFAIRVDKQPDKCPLDSTRRLQINISAEYTGSRNKSNMALIEVKMLSGFIPVKSSVEVLEKENIIQRSDIQIDMVTLYLDELGHDTIYISFLVEQEIEVKNLRPAIVKVYDYYETGKNLLWGQ